MEKVKIGIIGCGNISERYMMTLSSLFGHTEIAAVSDLNTDNACRRAEQFHIPDAYSSNTELLARKDIDLIVVLTNPQFHYEVVKESLLAGKHTYVEKPLSLSAEEGKELLKIAKEKDVMLAAAPDTILGAGIQMARKLIDDGWIGKPIAAISHILTGGPESWHPNPAFLYHTGAGPLYDVAPYYAAGLSYLLGPVSSVMCSAKTTYQQRMITSQPLYGTMIDVEVPTYLAGILNMENGVICTIHHSFDVAYTKLDSCVEIYGTEGTLVVPSPCDFSGDLFYQGRRSGGWDKISPVFAYQSDCRGVGAADMADAVLHRRSPRLNGEFAYHTLEVLEGLERSAESGQAIEIKSRFSRSDPMRMDGHW